MIPSGIPMLNLRTMKNLPAILSAKSQSYLRLDSTASSESEETDIDIVTGELAKNVLVVRALALPMQRMWMTTTQRR
jgi:hypothetical protein